MKWPGIGISPMFRRGGGGFASNFVFRTIDLGLNEPVNLVARDGAQLVYNEGKLHLIGGWNPAEFAATNDSTNEHWVNATPDDPTTWVQLADAPFDGVHAFGCVSYGGFIWKFGNDIQNPGQTSYKYNEASGWVLVSAAMTGDWSDRYVTATCVHKGNFYSLGGSNSLISTYYSNIIKSTDCVNWIEVGALPTAEYLGGILISDGANLYFWGGGIYIGAGQDGIFRSTDDGATWVNIGTLPAGMCGTYQSGAYFEGKFWHLNGYLASNQRGLYYTTDFATWTQLYDNPKETHASAFGVGDGKLYRITGNLDNFMYSVDGVATPENTIPTGASAIYSVRNQTNFIGSYAMEVQRSTDNATLDIGFVGNDIDESAMTTFMGAGDLFVSKWYDRSGNGNHAANTLGNRPRIGSGGVLDKVNGKVAVFHNTETKRLVFDSSINLATEHTVFSVINQTANDREFIGGAGNTYLSYRGTTNSYTNCNSSSGTCPTTFALNNQFILTDYRNNKVYQRYHDGSIAFNSFSLAANNSFTITNLSGESVDAYNFLGYMQEVIIYSSDKLNEKAGIEQNINDYFSIY